MKSIATQQRLERARILARHKRESARGLIITTDQISEYCRKAIAEINVICTERVS
jgi:hypothetical protein